VEILAHIKLGTFKSHTALLKSLRKDTRITKEVKKILYQTPLSAEEVDIDLVTVSLEELGAVHEDLNGYKTYDPIKAIYAQRFSDFGLEVCPLEVAFQLCLQSGACGCSSCGSERSFQIAHDPILDSTGDCYEFLHYGRPDKFQTLLRVDKHRIGSPYNFSSKDRLIAILPRENQNFPLPTRTLKLRQSRNLHLKR
jgi:hypothetical protein